MRRFKYMVTAAAGIALSGCASFSEVHTVNHMRTAGAQGGTAFTQALTTEYRAQTIDEADHEFEWEDAAFFARKGLSAAKGEVVAPAEVATAPEGSYLRHGPIGPAFAIPSARVPELSGARARLVAFLDGGGRDLQPVVAAHAQGLYDCWLEEEWEGDTNIDCRAEFLKIEKQFKVVQTVQTAPAATAGAVGAVGARMNTFQVFFDFDRSNIDESAANILQHAAASAKQGNVTVIDLTGHTDAAGPDAYNQALSERRANAVKAELVKDGVPAVEIKTFGVGKAGQLVPTADGVREPQNRRTEIILQ